MLYFPLLCCKSAELGTTVIYKHIRPMCVFTLFQGESRFQPRTPTLFSKAKTEWYENVNWRYMAGHAKWQNVKHIKAERDRQKNLVCNKYSRLISLAVKEKGPDPKINSRLASLLEEAKKHNVPLSTVESSLKKSNNKKTKGGTIEILGPGGCFLIIDYETDNISVTRHDIKILCRKYSANVLSGDGRWRTAYEQKGIAKVVGQIDKQPLDAEKALDIAIEAGAEEVQLKEDEEGKAILEFLCGPDDLHPVKKELEKHYVVEEAYVGYIPSSFVQLSKDDMTLVDNLLEELGDLQDVIRLYENVQ